MIIDKKEKPLTVKRLIKHLKKCKNKKNSEIEIFCGDDNFTLKRIGQFGIVTDVIIELNKKTIK